MVLTGSYLIGERGESAPPRGCPAEVDGWEHMRVTDAAQAVQRSAHPERYQKHAKKAKKLARALRPCR